MAGCACLGYNTSARTGSCLRVGKKKNVRPCWKSLHRWKRETFGTRYPTAPITTVLIVRACTTRLHIAFDFVSFFYECVFAYETRRDNICEARRIIPHGVRAVNKYEPLGFRVLYRPRHSGYILFVHKTARARDAAVSKNYDVNLAAANSFRPRISIYRRQEHVLSVSPNQYF